MGLERHQMGQVSTQEFREQVRSQHIEKRDQGHVMGETYWAMEKRQEIGRKEKSEWTLT